MKFTLLQLVNINSGINAIAKTQLPAKIAFRIARFTTSIAKEMKTLDEQRTKLLERYGEKKDKEYSIPPENQQALAKEMSDVLSESVEIDFVTIPLSEVSGLSISVAEMVALSPIFSE